MPDTGSHKNIVICCDGTGNQFGDTNSNVVKLYTALTINNQQVGYYHPGVGTMGAPQARSKIEKFWSRLKGLAFAAGFMDNVKDAYLYLMNTYNDGDDIYLFGFSRGAYTARALAARSASCSCGMRSIDLHAHRRTRLATAGLHPRSAEILAHASRGS